MDMAAMFHRTSAAMLAAISALPMILLWVGNADAALPPPYERWRIFRVIIENTEIPIRLYDHGSVDRIERREDGTYRAWAGRCYLPITVITIPIRFEAGHPPPPGTLPEYKLELGAVTCR